MSPAASLLLDEMLTAEIAHQLRERGHDVYAVTERAHLVSLPDDEVLSLATSEGRTIVTANVGDFAVLAAQWAAQGRHHGGMALVTTAAFPQDRSFIAALVKALDAAAQAGKLPGPGQVLYLPRPR